MKTLLIAAIAALEYNICDYYKGTGYDPTYDYSDGRRVCPKCTGTGTHSKVGEKET